MPVFDAEAFARETSTDEVTHTLAYAGLLQMIHEFIKSDVIDRPRSFFGGVKVRPKVWMLMHADGDAEWKREVLSRDPKSEFAASVSWLIAMGALDEPQAASLKRIREHRNALTHELALFVFDPAREVEPDVLVDALRAFEALDRFGTEIDISIMGAQFDTSADTAISGPAMILGIAVGAFFEKFGSGKDGEQTTSG